VATLTAAVASGSVPSTTVGGRRRTRSSRLRRASGDGVPIISSTGPRRVKAPARIEASSVSPTMNDPVMMAVPSIEPMSTRAVSRGRRRALRTASRRSTGLRART
jgi:hypothetical protein